MNEEIVLKIVKDCYPDDMNATGGRGEDVVGQAVDNEPLTKPEVLPGRANDTFVILEHIYRIATFIKCVVDVVLALRKEGREAKKEDVEEVAQSKRIYIPSNEEVRRILESSRRFMG